MRLLTRLRMWLSATFRRSHLERDMDAELRFHIDTYAAELVERGVPSAEALRRARIEFGGIDNAKEECREARGVTFLETLIQDLRFGARTLRKSPGFAVTAILTLALGIGATSAVFSVVNAVLLKPLPYPRPDRIVMPWWAWPVTDLGDDFPWGQRDFVAFQRQVVGFQSVGAFKSDSFNLTGFGDPIRLDGIKASAGFFPALGVPPLVGRTFTAQEEEPGHELEVVLSHSLWLERFGGDPGAIGRAINLNGLPYTVIGVMPPGFVFPRGEEMPVVLGFPRQAQLWIPNPTPLNPAGPQDLAVVGRLRDGVTFEQAFASYKSSARIASASIRKPPAISRRVWPRSGIKLSVIAAAPCFFSSPPSPLCCSSLVPASPICSSRARFSVARNSLCAALLAQAAAVCFGSFSSRISFSPLRVAFSERWSPGAASILRKRSARQICLAFTKSPSTSASSHSLLA
jgi:hypothetical protein